MIVYMYGIFLTDRLYTYLTRLVGLDVYANAQREIYQYLA